MSEASNRTVYSPIWDRWWKQCNSRYGKKQQEGMFSWTKRLVRQVVSRLAWQAGFLKVRYGKKMRNKTGEFREKQGSGDPTPWIRASRWRCRNWIQPSFIILSLMNERICGELNYNSCGLQGQRTNWSLTIEYAFELWCWRKLLRVPWTARRSN